MSLVFACGASYLIGSGHWFLGAVALCVAFKTH